MQSISLKEFASASISTFLGSIGFKYRNANNDKILSDGLLYLVNELADYFEEGTKLFPEIIIVNTLEFFDTIPGKIMYTLYDGVIEEFQFKQAIKMCAPLVADGWYLFIEVSEDRMRWGVITTELNETVIPLGLQIIHDTPNQFYQVIYIRNIGNKNVLLQSLGGIDNGCQFCLTLNDKFENIGKDIDIFCDKLIERCENKDEEFDTYIRKIINKALRVGHGNLFVIIDDIDHIPGILQNGVQIKENPIKLFEAYTQMKESNDVGIGIESNYRLHMLSDLAIKMMNHDGITLFTRKAEIIGYHYIVENNTQNQQNILGGARSKAFEALSDSQEIPVVFMKKQEGETKIRII